MILFEARFSNGAVLLADYPNTTSAANIRVTGEIPGYRIEMLQAGNIDGATAWLSWLAESNDLTVEFTRTGEASFSLR